jgi:hypothetical protein
MTGAELLAAARGLRGAVALGTLESRLASASAWVREVTLEYARMRMAAAPDDALDG